MSTVIDILEELEATAGRNDKEAILRRHRDNELLKRVFVAAQDPYTTYGVSKFKMPPKSDWANISDDNTIHAFLVALKLLASREFSGNEAKEKVIDEFCRMNDVQRKWCHRILIRNLRCGVQDSTVNKVWKGAIRKFEVQLANVLRSEHKGGIRLLDPVSYPVRVEPKLDGLRCVAVKNDAGIVTMYKRSGEVIETLPRIKLHLELNMLNGYVFDGEVMGKNWNDTASVMQSSKKAKDDVDMVYHVFDVIPLKCWLDHTQSTPMSARAEQINTMMRRFGIEFSSVRAVKGHTVNNEQELLEAYSVCMDAGYEGVMVKDIDASYAFKRSDAVLKLKPCVTYEGVIVGHYEGREGTKWEGLFGGFHTLLPNGKITRLGGGFNDKMRAEIQVEGLDAYVGRIVELEAQPDPGTPDGLTVEGKARFPVFMRFRDAGDVDLKVIQAYEEYVSNV
jgi:ATP-dependent DNA ligase